MDPTSSGVLRVIPDGFGRKVPGCTVVHASWRDLLSLVVTPNGGEADAIGRIPFDKVEDLFGESVYDALSV
jgi:hypothetical protein